MPDLNKIIPKMNKILSIVLFLFVSITSQAQDKKAKELLDQVTTRIKSYNNISIDFKYSLNNTKENIGTFSRCGRFYW